MRKAACVIFFFISGVPRRSRSETTCQEGSSYNWNSVCGLYLELSDERSHYGDFSSPSSCLPEHDTTYGSFTMWSDEEWAQLMLKPCPRDGCFTIPDIPQSVGRSMREILGDLPNLLKDRVVIFIGDSVSELLFTDLSWAINFFGKRRGPAPNRVSGFNGKGSFCSTWPSSFSLCLQQAGRSRGVKRVKRSTDGIAICSALSNPINEYRLDDVVECLSALLPGHVRNGSNLLERDVIVVNSGLHHSKSKTLIDNVQGFVDWLKSQRPPPRAVWYETVPQHFQGSEYGEWPLGRLNRGQLADDLRCGGAKGACAPISNLPNEYNQKYNNVSTRIVDAANIPLVRTFEALAPYWYMHIGCPNKKATAPGKFVDCTHFAFPSPPLRFINLAIIAKVIEVIS